MSGGSSLATQSSRFAKAYIIAVAMFRGPDHMAMRTGSATAGLLDELDVQRLESLDHGAAHTAAHGHALVAHHGGEACEGTGDKGFVGACVKSKQIISVDDAYDDSRFNRSVDEATNFKTRSVMCVPVLNDAGDVVAVVQMINAERGVFDANDEKLGRMLAKHVAIFMAEIE